MKKTLVSGILFIALFLLPKFHLAQSHIWSEPMVANAGAFLSHQHLEVAVDPKGNIVSTGHFTVSRDFDPGTGINVLTHQGKSDVFVTSYSADGAYQWAIAFGGSSFDLSGAIATDTSGNVYVGGHFADKVDFDPSSKKHNLKASGTADLFIVKYSRTGALVWAKALSGTGAGDVLDMHITNDGQLFLTGYFTGNIDFDPSTGVRSATASGEDAFMAEYDLNGDLTWLNSGIESGNQRGNSLCRDANGKLYIAGTSGGGQAFIKGYSDNGKVLFRKQFSGGKSYGYGIIERSGSLYLTGSFLGKVDFDPSGSSTFHTGVGVQDAFLCKFKNNGDFIWAKRIGGGFTNSWDYTAGYALEFGPAGQIYMAGDAQHSTDFDPGIDSAIQRAEPDYHIYLARYDTNGVYLSAFLPESYENHFGGMVLNENREMVLAGVTYFHLQADPDGFAPRIPRGSHFLAKYGACKTPTFTGISASVSELCENELLAISIDKGSSLPSGLWNVSADNCDGSLLARSKKDTLWIPARKSGMLYVKPKGFCFPDSFACDSHYINVTLAQRTFDTITYCQGDTALFNQKTYTSTATVSDSFIVNQGCDSIHQTLLLFHQSYQDSSTLSLCSGDSFWFAQSYLNAAGIYVDSAKNVEGCDSISILNLQVLPSFQRLQVHHVCPGDSAKILGNYYSSDTLLRDSIITTEGCDSITTYVVSMLYAKVDSQNLSICKNDSTWLNGRYITGPGIYFDTLLSTMGCDSVYLTTTAQYLQVDTSVVLTSPFATLLAKAKNAQFQWISCDGDSIIPGETDSTFEVTYEGTFAVVVTQNGCTDTSACFATIIDDVVTLRASPLTVFPNPTKGLVKIEGINASQQNVLNCNIYNLQGQSVLNKDLPIRDGAVTINIQNLPKGMYWVELTTHDRAYERTTIVRN